MTDALAPLAGQLLGTSLASGLNLYAVMAVLGIASRFGWTATLPPSLRGLEDPLVITSAALLFLVEFLIDKVPHLDSLWDAVHTFIRPTAAALLAVAALSAMPLSVQLAGAVLAGVVALAAHGAKAGMRLAINAAPDRKASAWLSVGEDGLAIALAIVAITFPVIALAVVGVALLLVTLVGQRLWRAFGLGLRALIANIRGFFGQPRWRRLDEIPAGMRALLERPAPGLAEPRAARAAIKGLREVGAYRNGWLVVTTDGPVFLYRSLLGPRCRTLPKVRSVQLRRGPWADAFQFDTDDRSRCTLFLLKDGPAADLALSEFNGAP
ncbi:MAG TPA: DUF4126 domain-containing protein [Longimicrobiales bacterium]